MRSTLQYIYSISVLAGVLVTAYFFMNREENLRIYMQQNSNYTIQSDLSDPAVSQLMEFEKALRSMSAKNIEENRELSNQSPKKPIPKKRKTN